MTSQSPARKGCLLFADQRITNRYWMKAPTKERLIRVIKWSSDLKWTSELLIEDERIVL